MMVTLFLKIHLFKKISRILKKKAVSKIYLSFWVGLIRTRIVFPA